jgi:hypothetical protein
LIASTNIYVDFDLLLLKSQVDCVQNKRACDYALKGITGYEGAGTVFVNKIDLAEKPLNGVAVMTRYRVAIAQLTMRINSTNASS